MFLRSGQGVRLNGVIPLHQLSPELRQCCAAAGNSTDLGFDHGMTKAIVQVIDQQPSPTVRKSEVESCLGDRTDL
jgi:hypothetical protein